MFVGRRFIVRPGDSLALLAASAHLMSRCALGLKRFARSMSTSGGVDRVARALGIKCYESSTRWEFFGNLLDAGMITLCGKESACTGSDQVLQKGGLSAVLIWLNILAVRDESVEAILRVHCGRHRRNFHAEHDYEGVDSGWLQGADGQPERVAGEFTRSTIW